MNILFGITGSVAATLAPKLYDELSTLGKVEAIRTSDSKQFLGPYISHTSGDTYEQLRWKYDKIVAHIELREWADVLIIAPLSANTLAKMANGICDNFLTCVVRAWDLNKPIIVAPAMNTHMWNNPFTMEHLAKIQNVYDLSIISPVVKTLACGDTGIGAMANIDDIINLVKSVTTWHKPLPVIKYIPTGDHPGAFGTTRKHDIHTGVDLYTDPGAPVLAMESGTVVNIAPFTGPSVGMPWWKETKSVMVEGASGVINYGEVEPNVKIGEKVKKGQLLANVLQVLPDEKLRNDIPGHSTSMLHIELYERGTTKFIDSWCLNTDKPESLLDPTEKLLKIR